MSSFYEVTAASGTAAAGDDSTRRHRYGRLSRESSRRRPHPHGGVGRRRGRLLYSPYGLATKATGQPHAQSPAATTTLHRGRPTGSRGVLRACGRAFSGSVEVVSQQTIRLLIRALCRTSDNRQGLVTGCGYRPEAMLPPDREELRRRVEGRGARGRVRCSHPLEVTLGTVLPAAGGRFEPASPIESDQRIPKRGQPRHAATRERSGSRS